jgi:hypothetical protein
MDPSFIQKNRKQETRTFNLVIMKKSITPIQSIIISIIGILILLWVLSLQSCSVSKQLHQDKSKKETEITYVENTVAQSHVISDTKITENKDTNLVIPASELSVAAKLVTLLAGDTVYSTGNDLTIKTFYDSITKTIKSQATIEQKVIPFKYQKVTQKHEVSNGTVTTDKEEQIKQTLKTENIDKDVKRSSFPWWGYLILVLIVVISSILLFLKIKRYI